MAALLNGRPPVLPPTCMQRTIVCRRSAEHAGALLWFPVTKQVSLPVRCGHWAGADRAPSGDLRLLRVVKWPASLAARLVRRTRQHGALVVGQSRVFAGLAGQRRAGPLVGGVRRRPAECADQSGVSASGAAPAGAPGRRAWPGPLGHRLRDPPPRHWYQLRRAPRRRARRPKMRRPPGVPRAADRKWGKMPAGSDAAARQLGGDDSCRSRRHVLGIGPPSPGGISGGPAPAAATISGAVFLRRRLTASHIVY